VTDPMTQIEAVRRTWDAVEQGDRAVLRALAAETVHPDCEWTPLLAGVDGRTYHGPDGMVEFFEEWLGSFSPRYEDREYEQLSDDVVLASCRMWIESRETGVEMQREIAVLTQFEGGLLRRGQAYDSRGEAMEAAKGLLSA
jgi:ketosteroid isomerase-like protein